MATSVNYTNRIDTRVPRAHEPNNTSAFCNVFYHGIVGIFFFAYAFNNPDKQACWASNQIEVQFAFNQKDAFLETTEVSRRFQIWFMFGFGISAFSFMYSLLAGIYVCNRDKLWSNGLAITANVFFFFQIVAQTAWLIIGVFWRWDHVGKVCAGDYVQDVVG